MSEERPPEAPLPPVMWEAPRSAEDKPAEGSERPMTASDIIDRSLWIYRRGFLILLAVAVVVQVPLAIVSTILGQGLVDALDPLTGIAGEENLSRETVMNALTDAIPAIAAAVLVGVLIGIVAAILLGPALIETVSRVHSGRPVTIGDAYRSALRSAPAIFVGSIVVGLAYLGIVIGILVIGGLLAGVLFAADQLALGGLVLFLAIVALVVVGAYVGIRWAAWNQAVVLEHRGPIDALRRSWGLLTGSMWRTALLLLGLALVSLVANVLLGIVGGILGSLLPGAWSGVVTAILAVLTVSWGPILLTLIFFDLRARHEPPPPPAVEESLR